LKKKSDQDTEISQIPLNPPFSKGEVFLLPLVSDPGSAPEGLVPRRERSLYEPEADLEGKGRWGGIYEAFSKALKCYGISICAEINLFSPYLKPYIYIAISFILQYNFL